MVTPAITSSERPTPVGRALVPLVAAALVIVGAGVVAILLLGDPDRFSLVAGLLESPSGLVVLFAASVLCNATLILPLPGMALTAAAALMADPLLVGLVAGAGQAVGELTGYVAGRSGGAVVADRPSFDRLRTWMRQHGTLTIFMLALVPNPAFDLAGILAGALRVPVSRYLAAVGAAKVLRNTLFSYAIVAGLGWLSGLLGHV